MLLLSCLFTHMIAQKKTVELRVIHTSDVHGHFFPYDFINRKPLQGSMARISHYVETLRKSYGKNLLLFDSGDILQGQPTSYYYNYMRPELANIAASVVNYMRYDAQTVGNHDIETGHAVYDKWVKETHCAVLGANVLDAENGKPYFKPYAVFEREGVKIAVIGLLTPAIPNWLSEDLWSGLRFEEMVQSAQKWVDEVKERENPDIIIGLFHSGKDGGITTSQYKEDATFDVARRVSGFDLILFGHDHTPFQGVLQNKEGDNLTCLNPSCYAKMLTDTKISITIETQNLSDAMGERRNVERNRRKCGVY